MEILIFIVIFIIGFSIYKRSKSKNYPIHIYEIRKALETKSELLRYKAKDDYEADKFMQLSKDLEMINCSDLVLKDNWLRVRPSLINLTSEEMLRMLNLDSNDKVDDYKAALWDLMAKLERRASNQSLRG